MLASILQTIQYPDDITVVPEIDPVNLVQGRFLALCK